MINTLKVLCGSIKQVDCVRFWVDDLIRQLVNASN